MNNLMIKAPVIIGIEIICSLIWLYIYYYRVDAKKFAFNFHQIVENKELWRIVSGTMSHIQIMHLCFNLVSLWNTRFIEMRFGSITYFKLSFCLFLISNASMICVYWLMTQYFDKYEYVKDLYVVGYSAILFGFMSFECMQFDGNMSVFGANIPFYLGPFVLLILISLIVPNASFIGHFSGILSGFLFGSEVIFKNERMLTVLFWILFILFVAMMIYSIYRTDLFGIASTANQRLSERNKPKTKLVNGVIVRESV